MVDLHRYPLLAFIVLAALSTWSFAEQQPVVQTSLLMEGFPPPPEQRVSRVNFMLPPYNRWAFQHLRELQPTREVSRGAGPITLLASKPLDLGEISVLASDDRQLNLEQFLQKSYTESFLVLHRGQIVFERYMNNMVPERQHQMFSATKSFVGTLMLVLIEEGRVSADQLVSHYLPTLQKEGKHGQAFHYVTPNTDVLAWIISRVTGERLSSVVEEQLWQPLGAERDAYFWLDDAGTEMAGGGLNVAARDAARFGQMILQGGRYNGLQVIPRSVAEKILQPGDPSGCTPTFTHFVRSSVGHNFLFINTQLHNEAERQQ